MKKTSFVAGIFFLFMIFVASYANASTAFNGHREYGTDSLGYYYTVTGGKFPTGLTPNGDNASGGTFRFITDAPDWGYPTQTWRKDDWYPDNAGFALTIRNDAGAIIYDNNGIEDGSYGDYYNANGSHGTHGLVRGYSMSNNWDWIYAGYFKLENSMTIGSITGYFDANGGSADPVAFNPDNPSIRYRMNIWSNVEGDLLPTNTGDFTGDVFSSDQISGTFTWGHAIDRIMPDNSTDPIYRLVYTLDDPITLQPGIYWFSHDVQVVPVPGAVWLLGSGLLGLLGAKRRRSA